MVSLSSMNEEQLREFLFNHKDLANCAEKLYQSCVNGEILSTLSPDELRRIGLRDREKRCIMKLIMSERDSLGKGVWPKKSNTDSRFRRKVTNNGVPSSRRNPHVWIWNDASINSSGVIIIANIDNEDVYMQKHVVEILERSGLNRSQINIRTIKIFRWRAYVQLNNPKDVSKLARFSTVKFPDPAEGKLVYIVHTPSTAFLRSGNWPLDMLFVIRHEKLKTEYHDILDYTKNVDEDVYFAIAALVKLSERKTVVVLYRSFQFFEFLTQIDYSSGIKRITSPSASDLSELTIVLNAKEMSPVRGWKFLRRSNLNPGAKTFYAPNPMAREFMPQYPQPAYPEEQHYRITSELDYLSSTHLTSPLSTLYLHHEPRPGALDLTSSGGWVGSQSPRHKTIRHILTPLNESPPAKKGNEKQCQQLSPSARTFTPREHDFPSRPISRSTVNALFNATSNDSPRRRVTMRPGTPGSSKTSSDVSLKDAQSSDIDFKDKASHEKERSQKELRIMQNQIRQDSGGRWPSDH